MSLHLKRGEDSKKVNGLFSSNVEMISVHSWKRIPKTRGRYSPSKKPPDLRKRNLLRKLVKLKFVDLIAAEGIEFLFQMLAPDRLEQIHKALIE